MKRTSIWLCLTASLLILTTMADTHADVKHVTSHGFIIENQIVTSASSQQVWQALTQDINVWWPKDHTWWGQAGTLSMDVRAGGCFCEIADDKSAQHMLITYVEPQKLLRMTGGLGPLQGMGLQGALNWTLAESADGTHLTLTYHVNGMTPEGFDQLAPIVAQVQKSQLNALKSHIETIPAKSEQQ